MTRDHPDPTSFHLTSPRLASPTARVAAAHTAAPPVAAALPPIVAATDAAATFEAAAAAARDAQDDPSEHKRAPTALALPGQIRSV